MDLLWLVIPAAIVLFLVRTLIIARSLKAAAANPTLADIRAFRAAKRSLKSHRDRLNDVVGQPKGYLEAAKRLATVPKPGTASRAGRPPILEESPAEPPA